MDYTAYPGYAYAISGFAFREAYMSVRVDAAVWRRMLRERCLTGEAVRRALSLSPTTLAKFNRGGVVRDDVFYRVVEEIQRHPVNPIAQELAGGVAPLGQPVEVAAK
jgi:hypothetical protein